MHVKKMLALVVVLLAIAAPGSAQTPAPLTVTYIANEGFLVAAGERAILVDALFNNGFGRYPVPSDELRATMARGEGPFRRVAAFLVTHGHGDHVYAPYIADFLKQHAETTVVASEPVCAALVQSGVEISRTRPTELEVGASRSETAAGVTIKAMRVKHMMDPDGSREVNLAYLVTIGGRTVLHLGDGNIEHNLALYRSFTLGTDGIDVLFLPCFDTTAATVAFVKDELKPRHIVAMHAGTTKESEGDIAKFRAAFPNGVVLDGPLASRVF